MKRGMLKGGGKKGQFYLIAAVIIIAVLVGFVTVKNYATVRKGYTKVYDLGEELEIETGYVSDYGIYQREELNDLIDNWAHIYLNYTQEQDVIEDWIFIYGDEEELTALTFTTATSGSIGIITEGSTIELPITIKGEEKKSFLPTGKNIKVKFKDIDYDFELEEGETFFFIITGGEYTSTP